MQILIRSNEATAPDPFLLWDSIFDDSKGFADWALAGNAPNNSGGLAAGNALQTAVVLCMFSDAQLPVNHPLAYLVADGDRRGWWGDGIDVRADLGEAPLGSLLWVLERAPLTPQIANWAKTFTLDCLAPLQTQGAVSRIDCTVDIELLGGINALTVNPVLYGSDGSKVYDRKFALIWQQLQAAA